MKLDDIHGIGLPKWPQMRVMGDLVTLKQASEIIRRTDSFFALDYDGNARDFNKKARQIVKKPTLWWDLPQEFRDNRGQSDHSMTDYMHEEQRWHEWWDSIQTEYVHNGWVSNAFIFGPSGWCHPDGKIRFSHNVGKWPESQEILADWTKLAEAFPFVNLHALLMSGESCEEGEVIQPVVGFIVKDGHVEAEPADYPWFEPWGGWNGNPAEHDIEMFVQSMRYEPRYRECWYDLDQLQEWHDQVASEKGPFVPRVFK